MLVLYYIIFFILNFFEIQKYTFFYSILIIYFFYKLFYFYNRNELEILKKTNYYFYEKLSALKENFDVKNNVMKLQLEKEVINDADKIQTKDFFNVKSFSYKIFILLLLIILFNPVSVYTFSDVKKFFEKKIVDEVDKNFNGDLSWVRKVSITGVFEKSNTNSTQNIYNEEKSVLKDSNQIVSLSLKTSSNSLDLKTFKKLDVVNNEEYNNNVNVVLKTADVYEESLPLDKYSVIKNYFK